MFVGSLAKLAQRLSDISFWLHCTSKRRPIAHDQAISDRSRAGLDWTNFFLADVQMGFGSFLAFYLAGKGWSKLDVGYVLTAGGVQSKSARRVHEAWKATSARAAAARYTCVPTSGHYMPFDAPEVVIAAILEVLDGSVVKS